MVLRKWKQLTRTCAEHWCLEWAEMEKLQWRGMNIWELDCIHSIHYQTASRMGKEPLK